MPTELTLDTDLVEEARTVGHHESDIEAVTIALQEYIARRKEQLIVELFGTIEYEQDYEYKEQRRRQ